MSISAHWTLGCARSNRVSVDVIGQAGAVLDRKDTDRAPRPSPRKAQGWEKRPQVLRNLVGPSDRLCQGQDTDGAALVLAPALRPGGQARAPDPHGMWPEALFPEVRTGSAPEGSHEQWEQGQEKVLRCAGTVRRAWSWGMFTPVHVQEGDAHPLRGPGALARGPT